MGPEFDHIVVLGSRLRRDGSIPEILQHRLDKAVAVHGGNAGGTIIVSGGATRGRLAGTEADVMARYLEQMGVGRKDIVREGNSKSTIGNAFFVKRLLRSMRGNRLAVVTADTHAERSGFVFRQIFAGEAEITLVHSETPRELAAVVDAHEIRALHEARRTFARMPESGRDRSVARLLEEIEGRQHAVRRLRTAV